MKNKKNKFIAVVTLFVLCLNIFCLSSVCAYTDMTVSSSSISCAGNNDTPDDGADCCAMCDGHSCPSHYSFICHSHLNTMPSSEASNYAPAKEPSFSSIVLKFTPKPPCSSSLV